MSSIISSQRQEVGNLLIRILLSMIFLACLTGLAWAQPRIYAPDGTYLGNLSNNRYDPNSVSNPYGQYGSPYSPNSINNPYGTYGSSYSPQSPNNPYATGYQSRMPMTQPMTQPRQRVPRY